MLPALVVSAYSPRTFSMQRHSFLCLLQTSSLGLDWIPLRSPAEVSVAPSSVDLAGRGSAPAQGAHEAPAHGAHPSPTTLYKATPGTAPQGSAPAPLDPSIVDLRRDQLASPRRSRRPCALMEKADRER
ncbi:hypothetical protein PR202_ga16525 [Eleusine coracana subsp. coracana]|uniref:Uncharacterized protein n=1 Tax=Eleusine coracana subsp. coracana TaxID=191504 RepID=A0AAV5CN20_ELECO|nr:hypothetical protein PR202_ga16525 [Eleusine coracana subsp. coracana]